ncbi:MAG: alanyl-tRNA editing protein [Rhodobacteraceae bacterium]|nr:alanyl-tRNA editing protein [Paracoccaceae bacterium]
MTNHLCLEDSYRRTATGCVVGHSGPHQIWLDQVLFYASGGGQPHDTGRIEWDSGSARVVDAAKDIENRILLHLAKDDPVPSIGTIVDQSIDWERRYRFMRTHTALHLLSVVIPLPVTGGAISLEKGRLDFNMPDAIEDRQGLEDRLNELVRNNSPVTTDWITALELDRNPEMVKTMTVRPPRGSGRIRLICIGESPALLDRQPCGGTHVHSTGEIGAIRLGKVEKKGRMNRRVNILLE